jgi:hypothetical protein
MTSTPNRAARRRLKAEWRRGVRKMADQASGLWQVEVIRENSPHRVETVTATLQWFRTLQTCGDRSRPLCGLCEHEFAWPGELPAAMVFLAPAHDGSIASVTGVCATHAAMPDADLMDATFAFFRRSFLPDARRLDPVNLMHGQGGRA